MQASSIYVHFPFCIKKCHYCDFATFVDKNKSYEQKYINALKNEIKFLVEDQKLQTTKKNPIKTIFFGGGTPSILSPEDLKEVIDLLKTHFNLSQIQEFSLEANPGTLNKQKLQEFMELGINRFSLGVQSFDADILAPLNRGHSIEESIQSIELIKSAKPQSWSLDLIYGLPSQSLSSWEKTIDQALSFKPKHVSAYALNIEEKTVFHKKYQSEEHPEIPNEDLQSEMYQILNQKLENNGLIRYEISNWAQKGHESLHNINYWLAKEYYAFGVGAHGYLNSVRYENTKNFKEYLNLYKDEKSVEQPYLSKTEIPEEEKKQEQVLLGLRLNSGIKLDDSLISVINQERLEFLIKKKMVLRNSNTIKLSPDYYLLSNQVIAQLLN